MSGRSSKLDLMRSTLVGVLLVFSLDTELQSVVPLLKSIEQTYHLSATEGAWALRDGIALGRRSRSCHGWETFRTAAAVTDHAGDRGRRQRDLCGGHRPGDLHPWASDCRRQRRLAALLRDPAGPQPPQRGGRSIRGTGDPGDRCAVCVSFIYGGVVIQAGGSVRVALWIIAGISAALVVLSGGWSTSPHPDPDRRRLPRRPLLGGGFAALVTGISEANTWGWGSTKVLVSSSSPSSCSSSGPAGSFAAPTR